MAWLFDWDAEHAGRLFERSIALNPNLADSRIAYSDFCAFAGDVEGALRQGRKALELDPVSPHVNSLLAQAYYFGRRWEEGIEQLRVALEIDPTFGFAEFFRACIELATGRLDDAIARLERVRRLSDRLDFVGVLGLAYGRAGRGEAVRRLLGEVEEVGRAQPVPAMTRALLHLGLGDRGEMYRWLRRVVDDRSWHIHILARDPLMEEVRDEDEAQEILRRAGLR